MTDVLSDILETIHLKATIYFRTDFSAPWAVTMPAFERVARFHLILRGRCHVTLVPDRTFDLDVGDLILIPSGKTHVLADSAGRQPIPLDQAITEAGYDGRGPFRIGAADPHAATQMICGHFAITQGGDHPLLRALPEAVVVTASERAGHPLLDETLQLLVRRAFAEGLGAAAAIKRLSEVLFIEAVRASMERNPELTKIMQAMTDQHIGRALELVHTMPSDPWSVDSLAKSIGMSRSRFAERFTDLVGMAPMTYLAEWRMQKALARLFQANVGIKEIATEAGYQSTASFTRAFTQRFGAPPKAYRAKHSG